jgi:ABC-2 type transport system ATP-binding protein
MYNVMSSKAKHTTQAAVTVKKVSKYFNPSMGQRSIKQAFTNIFKGGNNSKKPGYWALKDINIEIKKGEFVGIVGRNGSGKSTLLKMIAGVYTPTIGTISVQGKLVPFIELGVGFNPELSGRDNVFLNGALLGFSRKEMMGMYDEIVEFAELSDHMGVKLKNYSSGMQVRLAFSIAIRAKSDVLIIDEVLAVGDSDFQRKCYRYFDKLKSEGATVILVTHSMDAVRQFCDRAILIADSRVRLDGSIEDVTLAYEKQFLTPNSDTTSNEEASTLDSGMLEVHDISLSKKVYSDEDKYIELHTRVSAKQSVKDLVFGYRIHMGDGKYLCGSNSFQDGGIIYALKKGDELEVLTRIQNIFADGLYALDAAYVFNSQSEIAYWKNSAVGIVVKRSIKDGMPIKVSTSYERI